MACSTLCSTQARLSLLRAPHTFEMVAANVMTSLDVICCHKSQIRGTEFRRPVFTVVIGKELFDQFFNAEYGYRAAFYKSPGSGLDANRLFLRTVTPRLLNDPQSNGIGLEPKFIADSLGTPSAKAWLAEGGKELCRDCPGCTGEWSTGTCGPAELAEIRNWRWEVTNNVKAEWGRKTPYLTKLRIMGAFIDDRGNELIPHDKRARADEIHAFGWS
jgi:hypothetical protein